MVPQEIILFGKDDRGGKDVSIIHFPEKERQIRVEIAYKKAYIQKK
jgi:hypothetical protein